MNKKEKNTYPAPFSIRFNKKERKHLELAAAGRPLAAYNRVADIQRRHARNAKKTNAWRNRQPSLKLLAKLLNTLGKSRIFQNINQLAKAANSDSLSITEEIINALKESVSAMI